MFKRILVATDGSELSNKAVSAAIDLAALHGAELTALTVVARYPRSYFDGTPVFDANDAARIEGNWTESARKGLEGVAARAAEAGVKTETVVVHSNVVGDAIITAAEKRGNDLIVMASHGRHGIQRVLLGSETQHVLTHSKMPVLVLR